MTEYSRRGLALTVQQAAQIVEHARAARPAEACGLLGGRDGRVETVYPLPNTEQSPVRYLAEPQAQVDAMLKIEERGNELVGIYHSHVNAPAHPSPRDVSMAAYPDAVHLIVSLTDGRPPVLGGSRIREGEIEEVDVVVERPERIAS
ncbi:MAG: M67 family metallopeptidase [Chloroflexota bacterium]|nr:M67 family metallopeptidase [Chloroflexota bacterium]